MKQHCGKCVFLVEWIHDNRISFYCDWVEKEMHPVRIPEVLPFWLPTLRRTVRCNEGDTCPVWFESSGAGPKEEAAK